MRDLRTWAVRIHCNGATMTPATARAALMVKPNRRIRVIAGEDSEASAALFYLVKHALRPGDITLPQWVSILETLDSCELSAADWLLLS